MNTTAKILIVDDNPDNLFTMEAVLEPTGFQTIKARSGREALSCLLKEDIALILLDVQMPDMSGFETASLIRKQKKDCDIPIIFVTAEYTSIEDMDHGYALQAVDYLLKPLDPNAVRARVSLLMDLYIKSRQVEQQAQLLRDSKHHLELIVTEIGDANKDLYQEIRKRRDAENELSLKNRDLETLFFVVSHDLREPLRAIQNFSRMVEDRYTQQIDEKGQDFLRRVVRGGERMERLLDDLLALSRAQRMEAPSEEIKGSTIVNDALQGLECKISKTGALVEIEKDLPSFQVSRTWAKQAIFNLVANGLKFTREGEPPDLQIGRYQENGEVGLIVRDRGPGVAPDQAERIFQLFQRAVGREVEGTGAGLAIVREIGERHGGRAWVQPRDGGGSEFIVTFGKPTENVMRDA